MIEHSASAESFFQVLPGRACVVTRREHTAALVANGEQTLAGIRPIDCTEVEMRDFEFRPSRAAVGRHRATAVNHETREPLARRVRLQSPSRLAASADCTAIAACKRRAVIAAAPQSLVAHHHEHIARHPVGDHTRRRPCITGLHRRSRGVGNVRPLACCSGESECDECEYFHKCGSINPPRAVSLWDASLSVR